MPNLIEAIKLINRDYIAVNMSGNIFELCKQICNSMRPKLRGRENV